MGLANTKQGFNNAIPPALYKMKVRHVKSGKFVNSPHNLNQTGGIYKESNDQEVGNKS